MNNITTLKPKEGVELLAIVVDKDFDINDCEFIRDQDDYNIRQFKFPSDKWNGLQNYSWINLGKIDYSILGTVEQNKPIEFDCDGLVFLNKNGVYYQNYKLSKYLHNEISDCLYSQESFISLLEANNINLQQLDKDNKKLIILIKQ